MDSFCIFRFALLQNPNPESWKSALRLGLGEALAPVASTSTKVWYPGRNAWGNFPRALRLGLYNPGRKAKGTFGGKWLVYIYI